MCTPDKFECIENIEVDISQCLEKCSGKLITSYDQREIENEKSFLNTFIQKQMNYFGSPFSDKFKGLLKTIFNSFICHLLILYLLEFLRTVPSEYNALITNLSEEYWKYKGAYQDFPSEFRG